MGLECKSGPKVVPNGSSGNYCKVSNGHVIEHVLVGQNRGSTGAMNMRIPHILHTLVNFWVFYDLDFSGNRFKTS